LIYSCILGNDSLKWFLGDVKGEKGFEFRPEQDETDLDVNLNDEDFGEAS
jgi:hypothetical protein